MAWLHFRAVADRFTHIDATFVRADIQLGASSTGATVSVTVAFYPWWEHPAYLAARAADAPWGFTGDVIAREVTVRAIDPVAVHVSPRTAVIDWDFTDAHPIVWDFVAPATLYINGPFDAAALLARLEARRLPYVTRRHLRAYVDPARAPVASCALALPPQLVPIVAAELAAMHVPTFLPRVPAPSLLVAFVMDNDDYIVARDFELDVPDFTHDPAWFAPA